MDRKVTEQDFRMPEFRNAKVEDYEFRADGKLVRKDRWEQGIHSIVSILGRNNRDFEIPDIVDEVRKISKGLAGWDRDYAPDEDVVADILLVDGSILRGAKYDEGSKSWEWQQTTVTLEVEGWQEAEEEDDTPESDAE